MSRLIFEARRRLPSPVTRKGSISIEAPPELPRVIPPSLLRRALPVVIVLLIVGMIVAMVATGMRLISPQTLFFPFGIGIIKDGKNLGVERQDAQPE